MAYTDDAVLAKLSALNESHDSIATAAQWIMFHRRHAEKTVQLWFQRLKDSPSAKRLNLVYLANEVTQQSKARHKDDFVLAFSPVVAEAIAAAYKGASSDVQGKLRRVVEVWHDRNIFEAPIQAAVEKRVEELDKARGGPRSGGSIFGNNASAAVAFPPELASLVAPQQNVSKILMSKQGSINKADSDFQKVVNGPAPAPPVHAARLNGLLKTFADAEQAVGHLIKARTDLKTALEALLADCQAGLDGDLKQQTLLAERKQLMDSKKHEVEDQILRGLNALDNNGAGGGAPGGGLMQEPQRPEMEALTPPATEPDDPTEGPAPIIVPEPASATAAEVAGAPTPAPTAAAPSSGMDILSHLAAQAQPVTTANGNKRRRLDNDDDDAVPNLDDGIDADVTEALRKESNA